MQFPGNAKPPVGTVIDMDMGNGIDDALALALLYGLDGKNETRVVSVSVSTHSLSAAAFCEVMGRFYAGSVDGGFASMRRALPVGMSGLGKPAPDTPMLTGPLSRKNAEGAPVYAHGLDKENDTAEPVALIRNAFTAQHDQNCIMVLTGPATTLAKVLALPGAKDLIERKVRLLSLMGGDFAGGKPEFNVKSDIAAAKKVFAEWPTPIVASGYEVGKELLYPASSIEKDFAWTPNHPLVDAYKSHKPMPYDAPTWDVTAVLHALRPNENYFKLSEPGVISVSDDGATRFTPQPGGKHRHLIYDPAQKDRVIKTYVELISAKPVPRTPRFRRPQQDQQQQQQQQQKPAEVKPPAAQK